MADVKRTNYFDRQFLRARDFQDEQAYHLDQRRRHNRLLHTPGVAEGLVVSGSAGSPSVTVSPGVAVDEEGQEIVLSADPPDPLPMPTGQESVDIFISYSQEPSDPSADPGITGFTRITESPKLSVEPTGTVPARGVLLARVPLNSANGQINGAINNNVRTMASSSIIGDGAITEPKLAIDAVSTRTIQDDAVNADKILDGSVGTDELDNNAVTEPKLAINAVSTRTIQDDAVNADKILDLSVGNKKLAKNAVTASKLQSDPSDNTKRAVGKLHIQNESVSIAQLSASVVFDSEVSVPGTIPTGTLGEQTLVIQLGEEHAFFLISTRYVSPRPANVGPGFVSRFTWTHRTALFRDLVPTILHRHELVIQNTNTFPITVSCKVYRLSET